MPRNIMREFVIDEISAVDLPAQKGAVAVIMKRNNKDDPKEDLAKGAALTKPTSGHTHLLGLSFDGREYDSGMTSWENGHSHPWIRTAEGKIVVGEADNHTHKIGQMSKLDKPVNDDKMEASMPEDNTEDLAKQVSDLQAQLDEANVLASLSDVEKAHLETLNDDISKIFLAKSAKERIEEIDAVSKVLEDNDPIVYITSDGIKLHKSVGEAFIAMAKSNDEIRKDNAELRAGRENDLLIKRAETELAYLPGTIEVRASMLKAIDGIEDKTQREAALSSLKAQNATMSKAFDTVGHGVSPAQHGSDVDELDTMAKEHMKAHPDLSYAKAYSEVVSTGKGSELYQKMMN